jgi:ATP-dependent protease ClpP protease subunit
MPEFRFVPSPALNRIIWAGMLLLLVVLGLKTRDNLDMYFEGVGNLEVREPAAGGVVYMRWRGRIDAPMESRIAEAFERHRDDGSKFILALSSGGGSLDHGARVVRLLRKIGDAHGLETVVESGRYCASMCVPIYLQGQHRTAAANAKFMFHEVSFKEYLASEDSDVPQSAKVSETDRLFNDYFKPAGVPDAWISKVRADMAGGSDIWKTARELIDENAGVVQQVRE